jgi:hypothetical protein
MLPTFIGQQMGTTLVRPLGGVKSAAQRAFT